MIILDVETTGLDSKRHSIASIGAVDFLSPLQTFYQECRIPEGAEIDQRALEINGFDEASLRSADKPSLEEVIFSFRAWYLCRDQRTLAGENPSFDRDFVSEAAKRYGITLFVGHRTIDLHTLCYAHHLRRGLVPPHKDGRTNMNTDSIFVYVGLPPEPKPHHALVGAVMETEAFSRLIYGKPLLADFQDNSLPAYLL